MSNRFSIKQLLENMPYLPVLFVSDPIEGDLFEFGTLEELENELEERTDNGEDCELTTGEDLLQRLDFEVYNESPPRIIR